nr:NADH dehydrogenase subunit 4 [Oxydromus sp. PA-2020]
MLKVLASSLSVILLPLFNVNRAWQLTPPILFILSLVSLTLFISPSDNPSMYNLFNFLDSLSSPLITLTLWVTALMIISSSKILHTRTSASSFIYLIIILMMILLTCFSASNMLTFYIFFEASLIPTLFIILGWGYQPERLQAGIYLMMYTITASLPLLMTITYMHVSSYTSSMFLLYPMKALSEMMPLWWLLCSAAFLAKMPLFLLHLWLPKAHVEAPVAGSMILAAVLLKLGSYGILRYAHLMIWINTTLAPLILSISMWGAVITGLICMRQTDMKSLIAYSSIGHMGILLAGTMSNTSSGWSSSLTMMLAHGLCSSSMFALANMNYETFNTRNMFMLKGLLSLFPMMSLLWFMTAAANMAAPPTINLLSEIILIMSTLSYSTSIIILLAFMSFIAAAYTLILYTTMNHGTTPTHQTTTHLISDRNYLSTLLHLIPLFTMILAPIPTTLWL